MGKGVLSSQNLKVRCGLVPGNCSAMMYQEDDSQKTKMEDCKQKGQLKAKTSTPQQKTPDPMSINKAKLKQDTYRTYTALSVLFQLAD